MPEIPDRFTVNEAEHYKAIQAGHGQREPEKPTLEGHFNKFVKSLHEDAEPEPKEAEVPDLAEEIRKDKGEHTFANFDEWLKSDKSTKFITNLLINIGGIGQEDVKEAVEAVKNTITAAEHEFSLPAVQGKLKEIATEAQARARKISGQKTIKEAREAAKQALDASSDKELDEKLGVMGRLSKWTNNAYNFQAQGQLLNPRVSGSKLLTDVMNIPVQGIFKSIGVGIEHGPTAGVKALLSNIHAYREAYKDAFRLARRTWQTGEPEFLRSMGVEAESAVTYAGEEAKFAGTPYAHGLRYIKAAGDVMSAGTEEAKAAFGAGGRLILSADQFAKAISWRAEAHMLSYYEGLEEAVKHGLVGNGKLHFAEAYAAHLVNHPSDAIFAKAMEGMHKTTFTEIDKLVKIAEQVRGLPLVKNFVLFFRTPYNLMKEGLKFTPLGFPIQAGEIAEGGLERATALAKSTVGTALCYEIWQQATKGNITGDGPQGKNRELWPGRQHPRSIKVNGQWIGYNHLGPFATFIAVCADSSEMYHASKSPSFLGKLADSTINTMIQAVEHAPLMQEMDNLVHAMDAWKLGGMPKAAREFITRAASSFVPAPVRYAAEMLDPAVKESQSIRDGIAENIPGWSKTVPARRNVFGHLQYPEGGYDADGSFSPWHFLANTMSPIPTYDYSKIDDVDKEMYRLQYNPNEIPQYYWKDGDVSVPLSPEQRDAWQRYTGHGKTPDGMDLHSRWEWLINQPWYKDPRLTDKERKEQFEMIHRSYQEFGKEKINEESKGSLEEQAIKLQMQEHGMGGASASPAPVVEGGPAGGGTPFRMPETTVTPGTAGSVINTPVPEATP